MISKEEVKKAVEEAARQHQGKLPCAVAQEIAQKLGVPLIWVGEAADELKVKIIQCQLGCF